VIPGGLYRGNDSPTPTFGVAAGPPGPSIAALVARVLVRGWRDVAPFVLAMWLGEALWLSLAVLGLAALTETFHWAFVAVRYGGVAYLLWLAWQMWRAPVGWPKGRVRRAPATRCGCSWPA
jgi:threonine/homoserine/homoserine lactone efflux protein